MGVRKYNSTLASSSLSNLAFLRHLLEELLDAANYTQTLIDREGDPAAPVDPLPPPPPLEPPPLPPHIDPHDFTKGPRPLSQTHPRVPGYPPGW